MKKSSLKSFIIGFVTCALFTSSLSYAAQYKPIQVAVNVVKKIIINGADKTPDNFETFLYEGNTYVPLSYIAKSLDKKIKWDAKTSTVYINDSGNERKDTYLSGYGYEELSAAGRLVVKSFEGNNVLYFEEVQPDKYRNNTAPSTISYKLDKKIKYKHLVGKFGFFSGGSNTNDIQAKLIVSDDKNNILYESSLIRGNMDAVNLNVDITDASFLKFEIQATSFKKGAKANIGFVDLRLSQE